MEIDATARIPLRACRRCGVARLKGEHCRMCIPAFQRRNELVSTLDDGSIMIPLLAKNGSIRAHTIVDAADAEFALRWRWHFARGYARRTDETDRRSRAVWLHRELLGLTDTGALVGDHINRDTLDNRRRNLRVVTRAGNMQNTGSRPGATSSFRGVSWNSGHGKWGAQAQVNGKTTFFGYFNDEVQAADAAKAGRLALLPYTVEVS